VSLSTFTQNQTPLFLMTVEETATPHPAVVAEWQDFFSHEMDRAIGLEQESRAMVAHAQSKMVEMLDQDGWLTPTLSSVFAMTAQMMQCCVEVQRNWLAILAASATASSSPMALPEASSYHLPAIACTSRASVAVQPQLSEEDYAHSMDVAIGADLI
jgi:hypothetical protein